MPCVWGLSVWPARLRARAANRSSAATTPTALAWALASRTGDIVLASGVAASAIFLTPDTTMLKTVRLVDGFGASGNIFFNTEKHGYVLFDLSQLAGNLSSTESGGACIYWTPGSYSRRGASQRVIHGSM
jgi:hypothetical protein